MMLANQIYDENKNELRLFTARGSVRNIAQKYYEKYPEEQHLTRYIASRRKVEKQIVLGHMLEMDKLA